MGTHNFGPLSQHESSHMKLTLIVQQNFDIDAETLLQAHDCLREGEFPTSEMLLSVRDELGHDISEKWRKLTALMRN